MIVTLLGMACAPTGSATQPADDESVCPTGDADCDGYSVTDGDCDDSDSAVNAGVAEVCNDGKDNDCDGHGCALAGRALDAADAWFTGDGQEDARGAVVAGGGDVDGDGFDDVLVAAPSRSVRGNSAGAVHVVSGSGTLLDGELSAGATIEGSGEIGGGILGEAAAIVGDTDGDGRDDIIIGMPSFRNDLAGAGAAYLLLGSASLGSGPVDEMASRLTGENGDALGTALAGAGDLDADGLADVICGSPDARESAGSIWIRWGGSDAGGGPMDELGTRLDSDLDRAFLGRSVAGAGDVNGDGFDDALVGGVGIAGADPVSSGAGALLPGGTRYVAGTIDDVAVARYSPRADERSSGASADGAGDVNGDGYRDMLIGSFTAGYLLLGSASPVDRSLADADARWSDEEDAGLSWTIVRGLGDVDGDLRSDLLFLPEAGTLGTDAWLVWGTDALGGGLLQEGGVVFHAEDDERISAIDTAGDFNGDGVPDLAFGVKDRGLAVILGVGL